MKKVWTLLVSCILLGMIGCNTKSNDPKVVLMDFFEALSKNDMAKARTLATTDSKGLLDLMETGMKKDTDKNKNKFDRNRMQIGEVKISGDKAIIAVTEKESGETINYTLKKENGDWKVAFDKSSILEMGMDKMKEKGISPPDSLKNLLEDVKNMNMDSLRNELNQGVESMDSLHKELEKEQ